MNLPETGDVTTPVDDPCQFSPAWRSMVASYLYSKGVRTIKDLRSIAMTGCVEVVEVVECEEDASEKRSKKGGGKGAKAKKGKDVHKKTHVQRKSSVPLNPFFSHPEYRPLANDKWIAAHLKMCDESLEGKILSDESVPFKLAERWYLERENEGAMKKRLEPLLLTDIGVDIITLDLIGMSKVQPAVEAYEKMYFNCRDENFALHPSMQLISRFAMPYGPLKMYLRKWETLDDDDFCEQDGRPIAKDSDVWRAIGATMGYDALIYAWGWSAKAHGLGDHTLGDMILISWKASVSKMLSDMFTGNISHEDASRMLASYTGQLKYLSDDRKEGASGEEETSAMLAVLYAAAPKMRVLVEGGEGMITDNEIQSRIAAQQAIDKTNIQDAGEQVSNEVIEAQIENAIGG